MGDRFPRLLVGFLVLAGVLGFFLVEGARRGAFADPLSTYRSEPDGARALYLVLEQQQLAVSRLEQSPELLPPGQSLVLLGVHFESESEPVGSWFDGSDAGVELDGGAQSVLAAWQDSPVTTAEWEQLLDHARAGATVLVALEGPQSTPFLDALEVSPVPAAPGLGLRTLVPAQPSGYTRGVDRLEAPVRAFLRLPAGAVPLLIDLELDEPVAAVVPTGEGRVLLLGAPGLAMNQHLAKADNARFWSSVVTELRRTGPVAFDEYHHGFDGERSLGAFASRYGLQYAVGQLLLGLMLWALALKRFGRPRGVAQEIRVGSTDMLLATSRIYREGRHHAHAAQAITKGLAAAMAARAGLTAQDSPERIAEALTRRGRADLARAMSDVTRQASLATSDEGVRLVARLAALAQRQLHHPRGPHDPS